MPIAQPLRRPSPAPLDELYRTHVQFVLRSLRRLGVGPEALEDACQDVFVVTARRWESFEGRSTLRTWFFGVAMRVARTHRRTRARHARKLGALGSETRAREGDHQRPHERADAQRVLAQLLAQLDEDKRAVYVLVELEGLSVVEVARGFDVNVNTIYTRLRAARRRLTAAAQAWREQEATR